MQVDVSEENENAEEEAYIVENPTLVLNFSRDTCLFYSHSIHQLKVLIKKNISVVFRTSKLSQAAIMEWQSYHV
jgi:hypothetical protein